METLRKNLLEIVSVLFHAIFLAWHTYHEIEIGEFNLTEIKNKEGFLEFGATVFGTLTVLIFIIRFTTELKNKE